MFDDGFLVEPADAGVVLDLLGRWDASLQTMLGDGLCLVVCHDALQGGGK